MPAPASPPELSMEALARPSLDRNAFALAVVAAMVGGACLGGIMGDWTAAHTDLGDEPSGVAGSVIGALLLGATLNGIVSLSAYVNARAAPALFLILIVGCGAAMPLGSAAASLVAPLWWQAECSDGNARACWAVNRRAEAIEIDKRTCSAFSYYARPCERLLERDSANKAGYCESWRTACKSESAFAYGMCDLRTRRCEEPAAPMSIPSPHEPDDVDED